MHPIDKDNNSALTPPVLRILPNRRTARCKSRTRLCHYSGTNSSSFHQSESDDDSSSSSSDESEPSEDDLDSACDVAEVVELELDLDVADLVAAGLTCKTASCWLAVFAFFDGFDATELSSGVISRERFLVVAELVDERVEVTEVVRERGASDSPLSLSLSLSETTCERKLVGA